MNRAKVIGVVGAVVAVGLLYATIQKRNAYHRAIRSASHAIGDELASKGNSSRLDRLNPRLQGRLADFARKRARVAGVLIGDEPPPAGDGNACSRLVLTNDARQGLLLRLGHAGQPGMFHVLGYRDTTK